MIKFLKNLFGSYNDKVIKRHAAMAAQINALEPSMERMSDEELSGRTADFRQRLERGEMLESLLPEAFAAVREAGRRVLGMRHFDVQLIGGMVLHEGNIAEMRTGEGKTLVATLPAYLNALPGQGVHVITVNDYLARRDAEWMGRIYRFLGLRTGLIVHGLNPSERRQSYQDDITYGTNNEFGFDYLRDNMVIQPSELVQRAPNYAIVDEVDSILIDEARTPLIISGASDKPTDLYYKFAKVAAKLEEGADYTVDEKARTVAPTEEGVHKVERALGVEHLYADEKTDLSHYLNQALKAKALMKLDRDYVVRDGQVIIVDEFTGRLMFGRRYSDGLHQAIEAKEGVTIERETETLAAITFQNYFRMYRKLSGMTGTALTEEEEFRKIYGLDVIVVPTNQPMVRKDLPDVVYKTERAKFRAVADEIVERHAIGQPLLVGTISIEKSEALSETLKKRGVPHQVLNAKYHEKEAEIIAQAGRKGAVTIATNMAGRGTDILLGGNPDFLAKERLRSQGCPPEVVLSVADHSATADPEIFKAREDYRVILDEVRSQCEREHEEVVGAGGLHIIGTERHESRRIDNQLRGRAGRQGDPGSSRFYVALEDDLMRLFGGEGVSNIMDRLGIEEDVPIDAPIISRAIENAQKKVEARNFDIRKHILEYDDVMNKQREVIYSQRRRVLEGGDLRETLLEMITQVNEALVDLYCHKDVHPEEWDLEGLVAQLQEYWLPEGALSANELAGLARAPLAEMLEERANEALAARVRELGDETMRELERLLLLRVVDEKWVEHLTAMDDLRDGIGLRAYGQRDPLIEYKMEAFDMFQGMIRAIREDVVRLIFRVNVIREPERRQYVESGPAEAAAARRPAQAEKKAGRNDPCPCGSGKKYKKCCGREG